MSRLHLSNGAEFGADLTLGKDPEAEALVMRSVPRNLGEGRQGDRRPTGFGSPHSHAVEQCASNALALMIGTDVQLLDVGVPIDFVHKDEAHRLIRGIDCNPTPPLGRVLRQLVDRSWLIIRDGVQAHRSELLSGQPFDLLKSRTVLTARCTDSNHPESMARTAATSTTCPNRQGAANDRETCHPESTSLAHSSATEPGLDRGAAAIAVRPPDRCSESAFVREGFPKPGSHREGRQLSFAPGTPPRTRGYLGHYIPHKLRECVGIAETVWESATTCALLDGTIWDPAGDRARLAVQLEFRCVARHRGFESHFLRS